MIKLLILAPLAAVGHFIAWCLAKTVRGITRDRARIRRHGPYDRLTRLSNPELDPSIDHPLAPRDGDYDPDRRTP